MKFDKWNHFLFLKYPNTKFDFQTNQFLIFVIPNISNPSYSDTWVKGQLDDMGRTNLEAMSLVPNPMV